MMYHVINATLSLLEIYLNSLYLNFYIIFIMWNSSNEIVKSYIFFNLEK
jgi:hypothetical protein